MLIYENLNSGYTQLPTLFSLASEQLRVTNENQPKAIGVTLNS